MIQQFYSLFPGSYIQTFDDTKQGHQEFVSSFPASELSAKKAWLIENNKRGMGVFITPNPCSGGRKQEHVTGIKWIYVDIDNCSEERARMLYIKSPIFPNIMVSSGRGFHFYWRVDMTKDQFERLVQGLIYHYDSDPAISSINEVLRLPGFNHMKDPARPKLVRILELDMNYIPPIDDMLEAYPAPEKQIQKIYNLETDELAIVKSLPIATVLQKLGVEVRRGVIWENGQETSAHVNEKQNYINRFSGKPGSGSAIDAAMGYGNMTLPEAIQWLKGLAGIKARKTTPAQVAAEMLKPRSSAKKMNKYYSWGTKELTENFAPIKRDTYALVGAGYGVGKTSFCMHLGLENARLGHKVLYISLEMDNEELLDYLARKHAQWTIPEEIYRRVPDFKQEAYSAKRKELADMEKFTLRGVRGGSDVTWPVLVELIKGDWDLIIVDNFNLVAKDAGVSQYEHEGELSKRFLNYAATVQIPVIVVHHYSQGGARESVKTGYSLSGSAKIKNDAMRIVLLDRKRPSDDPDATPLTDKEKAMMRVTLDKGRGYDSWIAKIVYFDKGVFRDTYPEAVLPHWSDKI